MKMFRTILIVVLLIAVKQSMAFDFTIRGHVRDGFGQPVAGQVVETYSLHWSGFKETVTDANGYYQIHFGNLMNNVDQIIILRTWTYCNGELQDYVQEIEPVFGQTYIYDFNICFPYNYPQSCIADFYAYKDESSSTIHFFDFSIGSVWGTQWIFNDSLISFGLNPSVIYDVDGSYEVTLIIHTMEGCTDSISQQVSIGVLHYTNGHVSLGNATLPEGSLYMFFNPPSGDSDVQVYKASIDNGSFMVPVYQSGLTHCMAVPEFDINEIYFPKYMATYYGNTAKWQEASAFDPQDTSMLFSIDLLKHEAIYYGDYHISGKVIRNDELVAYIDTIDAWIHNAPFIVYLKDEDGAILDFRITETNESFIFEDLPAGTYELVSELYGYDPVASLVQIGEQQGNSTSSEFVVGASFVYLDDKELDAGLATIKVYPNPMQDYLIVDHAELGLKTIELFSIDGKALLSASSFDKVTKLDLSTFPAGLYFLKIKDASAVSQIIRVEKL